MEDNDEFLQSIAVNRFVAVYIIYYFYCQFCYRVLRNIKRTQ